jgi:hypothetical protein
MHSDETDLQSIERGLRALVPLLRGHAQLAVDNKKWTLAATLFNMIADLENTISTECQ